MKTLIQKQEIEKRVFQITKELYMDYPVNYNQDHLAFLVTVLNMSHLEEVRLGMSGKEYLEEFLRLTPHWTDSRVVNLKTELKKLLKQI